MEKNAVKSANTVHSLLMQHGIYMFQAAEPKLESYLTAAFCTNFVPSKVAPIQHLTVVQPG